MDDTQVEPSSARERFLTATAHDMKNSVSVLSGTLERLLVSALPGLSAENEAAYPQLAHMLYQTKRLNDNLVQMLALQKRLGTSAYPFDVQPIELKQLVEQVASLERVLLKSRGIALELDYDPACIWHLDEDLLVGVLAHAINNAIHYTHDVVRLAIHESDGWLELRVEDNGPGYPPVLLDAGALAGCEFDGGADLLSAGTGLGLHFAGKVARMHRHRGREGGLRLENGGKYGGGCFILRLP